LNSEHTAAPPPFAEALRYWVRLGFVNFGGPAGQIAILHRDLVERRRWISEKRFLNALNFCMLLPGPEAQQLAIYIGWLLHGTRGGIVAGLFFVLPSVFILLALSYVYAAHGDLPAVTGALSGLKPVVVAIVAGAVWRIGRRVLRRPLHAAIAAAAFGAIHLLHVPFPWIVLVSGLLGFAASRLPRESARSNGDRRAGDGHPVANDASGAPDQRRLWTLVVVGLLLWLLPLLILAMARGWQSLHVREYRFFTQVALVTFGGAYAALAYVTHAAGDFGWITPAQAVDGLALAETTPGPLIMVLQFIGFLAAWGRPEGMTPLGSGLLGALAATYAIFLPSFFFVLMGAPYVEALRGKRSLSAALAAISAAVVGVIASLALLFGGTVLFPGGFPAGGDPFSLVLSAMALLALLLLRVDLVWIVAAGAAAGLLRGRL
jgi:chromate transporter